MRQHGLVGGHDRLAGLERGFHRRLCRPLRAADQLDDAIHLTGIAPVPLGRRATRKPTRSMPRSRLRSRAETAVTRISRPQRAEICAAWRCISETTADADGAKAGDADAKQLSHERHLS